MKKAMVYGLICAGLIVTNHCTFSTPSFDAFTIFIRFFYGEPQQQKPAGCPFAHKANVAADDYVNQLRHDLDGHLPCGNIDEIMNLIRAQLLRYDPVDLRNVDSVNLLLRSIIMDNHKCYVAKYLDNLAAQYKKDGLALRSDVRTAIIESENNNLRVAIEKTKHINGNNLREHFGEYLRMRLENRLSNPTYTHETFYKKPSWYKHVKGQDF